MVKEKNFLAAIEQLYDLFGQQSLDRAPEILANALSARSCSLQITDSRFNPLMIETSYFDSSMGEIYIRNSIFEDDVWSHVLLDKANTNTSLLLSDLVSEQEYRSSRFFNDFIRLSGDDTGQCLGFGGVTASETHFNLGLHRAFSDKPFGETERRTLDKLVPHLRRLLDAENRIGRLGLQARLYEDVIAEFPQPCILIGSDQKVRFANRAADEIFSRNDGLTCRNNRLYFGCGSTTAIQAIEDALERRNDHGGSALVPRTGFRKPYRLAALPFSSQGQTHALVLVDDPDRGQVGRVQRLQSIYKLTSAEAEIASLVADGFSADEAASQRGVSTATVKTLLNRVYRKMDIAKASELSRLVNRLPG